MTKQQAYRYLETKGAGFLANVILCNQKNPARRLKNAAALIANGRTVSTAQFSLDTLLIDGRTAPWTDLD